MSAADPEDAEDAGADVEAGAPAAADRSDPRSGPPIPMRPIGVVHTPFRERAEAPRQPSAAADVVGRIELFPGMHFDDALADLEAFTHLWVIFVFDRNPGWRPKVQPPRSARRRGVFATRSPHRPNPIGLSAVELVGVRGLRIDVRGVDMLDGSPVLDLKPYVAYADALPEAGGGWLDPGAAPDPGPAFEVSFSDEARAQLAWLLARGVDLEGRAETALRLGPQPHAYRRIRPEGDAFVLALKAFRLRFRAEGRRIQVTTVASGFRPRELATGAGPELDLHRAFVAAFPASR